MNIVAAVLNVVWFLFTCMVLVTDGFPTEALYVFFTLLHLVTPPLTVVVLFRARAGTVIRTVAVICNLALLGFLCWALLRQPPHPAEEGLTAYVVISALTLILSVLAILRSGSGRARVRSGGRAG